MKTSVCHGFSLLEVLISLTILSLALLGLDAMEVTALRESRETYFFNVATNQLQFMAECLRIYAPTGELVQQLRSWNEENSEVLPQGRGVISGNFPIYTLSLFWGDDKATICQQTQLGPSGCVTEKINLSV